VRDILWAIANVERFTSGMEFEDFNADLRTIHAVTYNFGVIGEASSSIPAAIRDQHPEVPWYHMRSMRNIVVHVYFGVSVPTLWQTLTEDLAPLVDPLQQLLEQDG